MRKLLLLLLFVYGFGQAVFADHITGGEMYYSFLGSSNGFNNYDVIMKYYIRCSAVNRNFADPTVVNVFDKGNGALVQTLSVNLDHEDRLNLTNANKCITDPPQVCYRVGYYHFTVSVKPSDAGFTIAAQVVFRVNNMNNLTAGYNSISAVYTAEIPGSPGASENFKNNSAKFVGSDLVVVCAGNSFNYSFGASDPDGDVLQYSFCDAFVGGSGSNGAAPPPYPSVPYGQGYNGGEPLGDNVSINPKTGLITGIAPKMPGVYVVTVCVQEIRNGAVIATQRKDIQINIASCNIASASLLPSYSVCGDTKTFSLANQSISPLISSQDWSFVDSKGTVLYTSTDLVPSYTFPDTGVYKVRLLINKGQDCTDSASADVRVFPGFKPDFAIAGLCYTKLTKFIDKSTSVYGKVNSWTWDLGEPFFNTNTQLQNPEYTYHSIGQKEVSLIVTDSKGCVDTIQQSILVTDKPPITLAFRDTLICVPDPLQLSASGTGNFSWSPAAGVLNADHADPIVKPVSTTIYFVDLDQDGCRNRDSVLVRVTDHVSLKVMADTTICTGDTSLLHVSSDGLKFAWSPGTQIISSNAGTALVKTLVTTSYSVVASIGSCTTKGTVNVRCVPYPVANAGVDTTICFNTSAVLHGTTDATAVAWSPSSTLSGAGTLNPVARPHGTTIYILSATDNKGCPKPFRDSVLITVLPKIHADAGRDSIVVVGQPVQLQASGGIRYEWSPPTGLSSPNIPNPVALYSDFSEGIRYQVKVYNEAGCFEKSAITIKVFKTAPTVFVPTAFSPNGDGKNDVFKPIAAGIGNITYFRVFNRLGQLVFSTTTAGTGWDGRINGALQASGVYVWEVQATDYTGKPYFAKGTMILVR